LTRWAKKYLIWSLKIPGYVPFRTNLTQFGPKMTPVVCMMKQWNGRNYCNMMKLQLQSQIEASRLSIERSKTMFTHRSIHEQVNKWNMCNSGVCQQSKVRLQHTRLVVYVQHRSPTHYIGLGKVANFHKAIYIVSFYKWHFRTNYFLNTKVTLRNSNWE